MMSVLEKDVKKMRFSAAKKLGLILCVLLMSSCTSLELGVHYGKVAYNKCSDLDKWDCLWYD
jgi:hypothetical protein